MVDAISESQLVQVGATPDGEFVLLRWGDPHGERHSFEITHGRFEHAMQQLNELAARLRVLRRQGNGVDLSVPLPVGDAQASASLGGDIVFLDIVADGSIAKVNYSLTAPEAEALGKQLLAAASAAKGEKGARRH